MDESSLEEFFLRLSSQYMLIWIVCLKGKRNRVDLDARNIELGQRAMELRYLDQGKVRQVLREANRQRVSFIEVARAWNFLDDSACRVLMAPEQPSERPKSSHSGQVQLPQVGSEIEGYQLTALLGKGGMGAVFKAVKPGLNGEVLTFAIKFILTADARSLERFEREAQAVAAVDRHPNIISIKSYLRWQGLPCLVFDFVEGEGLDDYMEGNSLTLRQSTKIVETIASALKHSHEKDILHRDLKPANVMIRKGDGQVFLTDFGLARLSGASALTGSQDMLGTPHYMSPEQAGSEHDLLGPCTDIWALGVIYYELVTGTRPFEGDTTVELITKIMFSEPRRPSSLNDDLPKTVDAVILKALRKEPGRRYSSAGEFLEECQRVLMGESVQASVVSAIPLRLSGLFRRYGRRVIGVLVFTIVALALLLLVWWHFHTQDENRKAFQSKVQKEYSRLETTDKRFRRIKDVALLKSLMKDDSGDKRSTVVFLGSQIKSIEALRALKNEGAANDFEDAFYERVSKQNWRELSDYSELYQGLNAQDFASTGSLSKSWKIWLQGARLLRSGDYGGAVAKFEKLLDGTGEIIAFSYFAIGLAESLRGDWESAVLAFEGSLEGLGENSQETKELVMRCLLGAREESYLGVLLSLGDEDRLKRIQEQLRGLTLSEWEEVNRKLHERFDKLVETKLKRSVLIYRQLKACAQLNSNLHCPEPPVKLHRELAAIARRTGDISQALYHKLRLQRLDPSSSRGVLSNDDLRQLILDVGFFKRDLEKAFLLTLAVSRAGLYVPYLREDWCEALDKKGIFDREVLKNPNDPYPRFWRAMAPLRPRSKAKVEERMNDIDLVLKNAQCREHFRAVMYQRRSAIQREQAKSLSSSESAKIARLLESGLKDVSIALKLNHPAPDKLYNEMCLLYEEYPKALHTPDFLKEWVTNSELWAAEIEKRYQGTLNNTLAKDRDEDVPLLPMSFDMRQRNLSFAYRNSSAACRSAGQFDKALKFAKLANRHATAKMNNKVGLFILKELLLCYIQSGRDQEAKAFFDDCVKDGRTRRELNVLRDLWPKNPPDLPGKKE